MIFASGKLLSFQGKLISFPGFFGFAFGKLLPFQGKLISFPGFFGFAFGHFQGKLISFPGFFGFFFTFGKFQGKLLSFQGKLLSFQTFPAIGLTLFELDHLFLGHSYFCLCLDFVLSFLNFCCLVFLEFFVIEFAVGFQKSLGCVLESPLLSLAFGF